MNPCKLFWNPKVNYRPFWPSISVRGFFGVFVLLAALQIAFFAMAFSNLTEQSSSTIAMEIKSAEAAGLLKSATEISIDETIKNELSATLLLNAEAIKKRVNSRIIAELKDSKAKEIGICSKLRGKLKMENEIKENFDSVTKVNIIKIWKIAIISYYVTGGNSGTIRPCTKLQKGGVASWFEMPIGYAAFGTVPLP